MPREELDRLLAEARLAERAAIERLVLAYLSVYAATSDGPAYTAGCDARAAYRAIGGLLDAIQAGDHLPPRK